MVNTVPTTARAYNLGPADQIPLGEGRRFLVGPLSLAVFRTRGGQLFATQAQCTHKEGPLADGLIGGNVVMCPLHAYKFNLATGQPIGHECAALTTYPITRTASGDILLTLPERP